MCRSKAAPGTRRDRQSLFKKMGLLGRLGRLGLLG
jgi:hypothetical protein